jgi:hypothetical protein
MVPQVEEINEEKSFNQVFGWWVVVNRVSKDDITRHQQVLEKGLVEVLNQLAFLIAKDAEVEKETKKLYNKL